MGDQMEGISELLSQAIVEYRERGSVNADLLKRIEELVSQQENPLLAEHLRAIVKSLKERRAEERSLLEKSLRLDGEELRRIVDSIERFLSEEPFRDMDSKRLLFLWKRSLEKTMETIREDNVLGSETETASR